MLWEVSGQEKEAQSKEGRCWLQGFIRLSFHLLCLEFNIIKR